MIIQSSESDKARFEDEQKKHHHLEMAEKASSQKREDKQKAKETENVATVSFDL